MPSLIPFGSLSSKLADYDLDPTRGKEKQAEYHIIMYTYVPMYTCTLYNLPGKESTCQLSAQGCPTEGGPLSCTRLAQSD